MKRLCLVLCSVCLLLTACAAPAAPASVSTTIAESTTTVTTAVTTTQTSATATSTNAAATTKPAARVAHLGLYDAKTLIPVYEQGADERIYPASLVKITTAYTALYYVEADAVFTVGSELSLVKSGSSVCRIKRGQQLTLGDLVAGMLLPSGNDAAYTVAVNVARTVAKDATMTDKDAVAYFCNLMNHTAVRLGAVSSHYVNPEGWDNADQYTTVRDLAVLIRQAMKVPLIRDMVAMSEKTVSVGGGATLTFRNTNLFLHSDSQFYDTRVNGFKTGSTGKAGKCLAVTFTENDNTYIAIVTNCATDTDRYRTMQQLLAHIA